MISHSRHHLLLLLFLIICSASLTCLFAAPDTKLSFAQATRWRLQNEEQQAEEDSTTWPVLTLGWRTCVAIILGALGAVLSSAGGIGGGGLYVPIFNLLLNFDSKTSAALSSFMIFGGTLVNLVWYAFQKHPLLGDRPLIDYDVALLCQPNVLLGISIGVICNIMSPSWFITTLLIITLSYMTTRSCKGAIRLWNAESASQLLEKADDDFIKLDGLDGFKDQCQPIDMGEEKLDSIFSQDSYREQQQEEEDYNKHALQQPLLSCQSPNYPQFPAIKVAVLGLIWFAFFAVQLVRTSADSEAFSNIKSCGATYWLVTSSQLPLAVAVTACTIYYLMKCATLRDHRLLEDDFVSPKSLAALPLLALLAGLLGGMLGLGGGMIISPLLFEMGMHPQVTAATCSFMIFFSSSLSVIQYWFLGRMPLEYGFISAGISLVFSVIGLRLVQKIISKSGRVSLIVFSVSTVMGLSAVLMAWFGSLDVWSQVQEGSYLGFTAPC